MLDNLLIIRTLLHNYRSHVTSWRKSQVVGPGSDGVWSSRTPTSRRSSFQMLMRQQNCRNHLPIAISCAHLYVQVGVLTNLLRAWQIFNRTIYITINEANINIILKNGKRKKKYQFLLFPLDRSYASWPSHLYIIKI